MVDNVVLVFFFRLVFDCEFSAEFFSVVYDLVVVIGMVLCVLSHFVDDGLSFVTSIRKCQCDECWGCFCVGVSGFIVGVCLFLFTFDDVVDDSLQINTCYENK